MERVTKNRIRPCWHCETPTQERIKFEDLQADYVESYLYMPLCDECYERLDDRVIIDCMDEYNGESF